VYVRSESIEMARLQTTELTIRPILPDDYYSWLPLWKGYLTFYKASISDEVTQNTWGRLISVSEAVYGVLAFNEENVAVGLVHYLPHRSTWTVGDYCYLQDLFVAEDGRGMGIGRRLIEYVCEEADRANCSRVYWLTHETNKSAMLLYDKVANRSGFVQYRKMFDNK